MKDVARLPIDDQKRIMKACERRAMRHWSFWIPFIVLPLAGGFIGHFVHSMLASFVSLSHPYGTWFGSAAGCGIAGFLAMRQSARYIDDILADEEKRRD